MTESSTTKEKIFHEALTLFADQGYEGTTMNDIASSVGIKAASLYAHYKGKEELFHAIFEWALDNWAFQVDGIFKRAASFDALGSGLELILGDFAASMMGSVAYRFWARIYVFPPPSLSPEDRNRMMAMDRSFAERLGLFCGSRLPPGTGIEDIEFLSSSLTYFVMGILMYAELLDEEALRREIGRGVAFHLRAMDSQKRSSP